MFSWVTSGFMAPGVRLGSGRSRAQDGNAATRRTAVSRSFFMFLWGRMSVGVVPDRLGSPTPAYDNHRQPQEEAQWTRSRRSCVRQLQSRKSSASASARSTIVAGETIFQNQWYSE